MSHIRGNTVVCVYTAVDIAVDACTAKDVDVFPPLICVCFDPVINE